MIQRVAIGNVLMHLLPEVSIHGTRVYYLLKKSFKTKKSIRSLFHFILYVAHIYLIHNIFHKKAFLRANGP